MKRTDQERSSLESTPSSTESIDLQEAIRRRAYQIYEARGTAAGTEIEDWLQAESELLETESPETDGQRRQNETPRISQDSRRTDKAA